MLPNQFWSTNLDFLNSLTASYLVNNCFLALWLAEKKVAMNAIVQWSVVMLYEVNDCCLQSFVPLLWSSFCLSFEASFFCCSIVLSKNAHFILEAHTTTKYDQCGALLSTLSDFCFGFRTKKNWRRLSIRSCTNALWKHCALTNRWEEADVGERPQIYTKIEGIQ